MHQDHNSSEDRGGRYSRRTRKKGYYIKKWLLGLGPAKLTLVCAGAGLVLALPVLVGFMLHSAGSVKEVEVDSVSLRSKQSTELSGVPGDPLSGGSNLAASVEVTPQPVATPTPTPVPTPTPEPHPTNTIIKYGMECDVVYEIQERLMKLGYMENDEPTNYYGSITKAAVKLFQRQHGLDEDGAMGLSTWEALISDDAQKYTVMEGMDGTDVKELQYRLRQLGYMDDVTGHFGELTVAAVKDFQEKNGLSVDGKVGSHTREILYSADAKANFHKYGEESPEIKEYQERLKKLGYLTTTPDGNYGKDTVAAVERFQEINGLIPDGFLGYDTIKKLKSSSAKANALQLGMEGDDVENVQKRLKKLGYMDNVTGYFGSQTQEAVIAFQKRNGLSQDGTVGKNTMNVLTSSSAKKASSSSSSSSGSSSSGSSSSSSAPSSTNKSGIEKFIDVAESKLGCKYVFSAKGPNQFDCSGFVYYCLNQAGVSQGYMTSSGWAKSSKYPKVTSMSKLERGDILVFDGHVAIYLGGGKMIDASSSKGKVVTRSGITSSSYWTKHFICAFRVF